MWLYCMYYGLHSMYYGGHSFAAVLYRLTDSQILKNTYLVTAMHGCTVVRRSAPCVVNYRKALFLRSNPHLKVEECKSHVLIRTLSYFSKWKR